jgi:gliding motility-associated-like protein
LSNPGSPSIALDSIVPVSCNGGNDGAIYYTITNGTKVVTASQISYAAPLSGATQTLTSVSNLPIGTYTINIIDSNACTSNLIASVTQPTPITLALTQDSVNCNGGNTGSIIATGGGANGGYLYSLSGPVNVPYTASNTFGSLVAGLYTVTVKDSKNCSTSTSISVLQPAALLASASSANINCFGGDTTITSIGLGGTLPYQYSLNGGAYQIGSTFANNVAGTYTISMQDANGCIASTTIIVTEPAAPLNVTITSTTNPGCATFFNTGTMDASAIGGTAAYTWSVYGTTSGQTIANSAIGQATILQAATYYMIAEDSKGCKDSASATLITPNAPIDTIAVTSTTCYSLCNGSATASPNGNGPFTYAWSCPNNASTTNVASNLCAGPCSVLITDINGCASTVNFTIGQPAAFVYLSPSLVGNNPTSSSSANGIITVTAPSGGTSPYNYTLSGAVNAGPQASNIFNGLIAGCYTVTIHDAIGGCITATDTICLTAPLNLVCNAVPSPEVCFGANDGGIVITVGGAVGPYTYSNDSLPLPTISGANNSIANYSSVADGTYTIVVTATGNGDTIHCPVTVAAATQINPSLTALTNPICVPANSGKITLSASGGNGVKTGEILQGATSIISATNLPFTFTSMAAGTYTYVVTDANGCTVSNTFVLTAPTPLTVSVPTTTNESCVPVNDGCIAFTVNNAVGTLGITFNGGSTVYSGASYNGCIYSANTYAIVITDTTTGCTVNTSATINPSPIPSIDTTSTAPTACTGPCNGTAIVTATGGTGAFTYSANGGAYGASNILTGLCFGANTLYAKDAKGCIASMIITIGNPNPPTVTVGAIVNASCIPNNNGSVALNITGGTGPYVPSSSNTGLIAGSYTFTVTDANGCATTVAATVGTKPSPVLTLGTITSVSCNGANNGVVNYTVTNGTVVSVTGTAYVAGTTFIGATSITGLGAGTFTITAYNADSCVATINGSITEPNILVIDSLVKTDVTINGLTNGTISAYASGGTAGYTYALSPNNGAQVGNLFTGLDTTCYVVTVTDTKGCTSASSVCIYSPGVIVCTVDSNIAPTCFGGIDGRIKITASNAVAPYSWTMSPSVGFTNGNPTATAFGLSANTYIFTVTDANGATKACPVTVTQPTAVTYTVATIDPWCNPSTNGCITVNASNGTGALTYTINGGASITNNTQVCTYSAGIYNIVVTDVNGCTASGSATLTVPTTPTITVLSIVNASCSPSNNGSVSFNCGGTISPNPNNLAAGTYTFTCTDAKGCTASTVVTIGTKPSPTLTLGAIISPKCFGECNGVIHYTSNGTISILPIGTAVVGTDSTTGLCAGIYTITSTNADGCTATATINITSPAVVAGIVSSNVISINGANTGVITVVPSGGTPTYTLAIDSLGSPVTGAIPVGNTFTNLYSGQYNIHITDAHGCDTILPIFVSEVGQVICTLDSTKAASCASTCDAKAYLTASNAVAPYTWSISGGTIGNTSPSTIAIGLCAGTNYTIIVTDANGATKTCPIVNITPTPAITYTVTSTNPWCNPSTNGTITVTVGGGTGTIQYQINGGIFHANGTTTNGLAAGSYTISVKDANNCTITTTITLTSPVRPTITVTSFTNTNCNTNNGQVVCGVSGNNGTYTIAPSGIGLGVGNYPFIVTDALGCKDTVNQIITTQPKPNLSASVASIPSCFGDSNAIVNYTLNNGTIILGGSAVSGNTVVNASNITGVKAGTLIITATNIYGCDSSVSVIVGQPTVVTVSGSSTSVTIFGAQNGTITITAGGGTPSYSYSLDSNGAAVPTATLAGNVYSNLYAGIYNVCVTDSKGCVKCTSIIVTSPNPMICAIDSTNNVLCYGFATGKIYAHATGGVPFPISKYNWTLQSPLQTSNNTNPIQFAGLVAGTYTLQATDANGATCSITSIITQPTLKVAITNIALLNPQCTPNNNGCITVGATGGTGAVNVQIKNSSNVVVGTAAAGNPICGLTAGTYSVRVFDANACDTLFTVTLVPPTPPSIVSTSSTDEWCNPDSNGTITITAIGGNGVYSFGLTNLGGGANPITGLVAGSHTVYVVDTAKCFASAVVVVNHKPNPVINSLDTTFAKCNPVASATVTVQGTGNALLYNKDNGLYQTSNVFNNITAGIHLFGIVDAFGCAHDTTITIYTLPNPIASVTSTIPAGCVPNNNGAFTLSTNAIGTAVAYTPVVAGATVTLLNGVVAGANLTDQNYAVTITDGFSGCTVLQNVIVPHTLPIAITNVLLTPGNCFGDSTGDINITTNFAIDSFTARNTITNYTWLDALGGTAINNVPAGNYSIVVTDSSGCKASQIAVVTQPTQLVLLTPTMTKISCNGVCDGKYLTTASGGSPTYSYTINGISPNTNGLFTGLCAGQYTVIATDNHGCTTSNADSVKNVAPVLFGLPAITNVKCNPDTTGKICITATGGNPGGYVYTLNPNATTYNTSTGCFENIWADQYTITAADNLQGCTSATIVIVNQPLLLVLNTDSVKNVSCFGGNNGSIKVSGSGGTSPYTYQFNGGAFTTNNIFNNLVAGNYTITIKDANACTKVKIITVSEPTVLGLNNFNHTDVTCFGAGNGTITTGVTGGTTPYTITLQPTNVTVFANTTFQQLGPGTYTVSTVDANGCTISSSVTITQPAPLVPQTAVQNVNCFGEANGSICITPTGGTSPFVYANSTTPGSFTYGPDSCFTGLIAGTYYIALKDFNNCTSLDTITITQPPLLAIVTPISTTSINCFGDSTGAISISVNGGTILPGAISYNFAIAGPTSINTVTNANGSAVTFNALKSGNYLITITDAHGCITTTNIFLNQNPRINFATFSFIQPRCWDESNGEIHFSASGGVPGYTYALNPGFPTFKTNGDYLGLHSKNYTAVIQDAKGCFVDTSFLLPQPALLVIKTMNVQDVSCIEAKNGTIQTEAQGGNGFYRYLVLPGVRINSFGSFGGFSPGTYTVVVIDTLGCRTDSLVTINLSNNPLGIATVPTHINNCNGFGQDGSILANPIGGKFPYTYLWNTNPPQTGNLAEHLAPGYYIVELTDADGCTVQDTVKIDAANCCTTVFLPNVFSPNNDGNNDKFKGMNAQALDIELLNFNVYDRWGNRVFNTVSVTDGWDGTFRDMLAEPGVYQYMYRYRCNIDNKVYLVKGDVVLTR